MAMRITRASRGPAALLVSFLLLSAAAASVGACSNSPADVNATFEGVIAGTSDSGPVTGSLTVKVDGATAQGSLAFATSGTTGTAPASTKLVGSAQGSSYSMASSDGSWKMAGSVSGSKTTGTLTGPNDVSANYSAEDVSKGTITLYCGTYSGSDSGTWNFVVSGSGDLSGAFAGAALGSLSGSGNQQSLSINWSASDPLAGNLSGTAQGNVQDGSVSGAWSGSGLSGTFMSDQSCPGAPALADDDGGGSTMVSGGGDGGSSSLSCVASGGVCTNPSACCSSQCYTQGSSSYCY
jgi:hypothetical protein